LTESLNTCLAILLPLQQENKVIFKIIIAH
jgi:hypothetical protein